MLIDDWFQDAGGQWRPHTPPREGTANMIESIAERALRLMRGARRDPLAEMTKPGAFNERIAQRRAEAARGEQPKVAVARGASEDMVEGDPLGELARDFNLRVAKLREEARS